MGLFAKFNPFGKRKKEKSQELEAQQASAPGAKPLQPAGNGGPAAGLAPRVPYELKAAHGMRRELQKALGRPVILPNERPLTRATRAAVKHRGPLIALGVLGVSIAAVVVTGGAAAVGLGIAAAALPAANIPTYFGTRALDPNLEVTLELGAAEALLAIEDPQEQATAAQKAIDAKPTPDGKVTLSYEDIDAAVRPQPLPEPLPGFRIDPVRAGIRTGLTVIGSGLLLLALTLIPQDIHTLMTRAASAILVVGVLIVAAAVANGSGLKVVVPFGPNGQQNSG